MDLTLGLCFFILRSNIIAVENVKGVGALDSVDIFSRMSQIEATSRMPLEAERTNKIAAHKEWLKSVVRERPQPNQTYRVAVYIRYFNQTKHENYLEYHVKQFMDTIEMCPKWTLVGIYVDEGPTAPRMESAPEWSRLLNDCMMGKIDLIITQKVSNIAKRIFDAILCSRLLASQEHPVGIYFISEDLFTLASYYQEDLRDMFFFPNESGSEFAEEQTGSEETDYD